jgi:hypothetical protein
VDGLIVGGDDTYNKDLAYPSKVYALIEHELGTDIETEAWKLAHWVAPLKVLIFYDWSESLKLNNVRRGFVDERINRFWSVVNMIRDFCPEPEGTEYLLIVGRSVTPNDQIVWERASNNSSSPRPLRGSA